MLKVSCWSICLAPICLIFVAMDRRDEPLGRRDFAGYHDDGRGGRGRNNPDRNPFTAPPGSSNYLFAVVL